MAKVNVIYDDLKSTSKNLEAVIDYLNSAQGQIKSISSEIESLNSEHNCFSQTEIEITNLERDFENYITEVTFLKNQCTNAANAFKGAEGENVKATEAMLNVLNDAALMLAMDKITNPDISVFENREKFNNSNVKIEKTSAKASETWENTFSDKNNDGLREVNADISTDSKTVIDSDKKEESDKTDNSNETSSSGNNEYDGGSYSGNNGGGYSGYDGGGSSSHSNNSGSDNYNPSYSPTDTSKNAQTTLIDTTQTAPTETISEVNLDENTSIADQLNPTPTKTVDETLVPTNNSNQNTTTPSTTENASQTDTPPSDYSQLDNIGDNSSDVSGFQPNNNQSEPDSNSNITPSYNYSGGSYSEDTGYVSANEENGLEEMTSTELETPPIEDANNSINDVIKKGRYTKIPTSSVPIEPQTKTKGNAVIPIAAGISAAAAAGIGAKAYMDHKNNSITDEDIDTEDWSEDDSLLEIEEDTETPEELSSEDEYTYQEENEKYSARDTSEITEI